MLTAAGDREATLPRPTVYHIPVCPYCQRIEIALGLKGVRDRVDFCPVDITKPRDPALLAKTRGSTTLPVLETEDGHIVKESLVILRWVEDVFPERPLRQRDPWRHAVENMLIALEGELASAGYKMVRNQDRARRGALEDALLAAYGKVDRFLREHAPEGPWLFEDFGLAETVFAPIFQRFWFLDYYERLTLPAELERVARWQAACREHPAAAQTSREEVVKTYYDYAKGAANAGLLPGRTRSSFAVEPHWSARPWPPADKYGTSATDAELGLLGRPA
jgi:glutathione S-transferase